MKTYLKDLLTTFRKSFSRHHRYLSMTHSTNQSKYISKKCPRCAFILLSTFSYQNINNHSNHYIDKRWDNRKHPRLAVDKMWKAMETPNEYDLRIKGNEPMLTNHIMAKYYGIALHITGPLMGIYRSRVLLKEGSLSFDVFIVVELNKLFN